LHKNTRTDIIKNELKIIFYKGEAEDKMGDINVYTGPMKCGKSHVILQEAKRQMIAGKTIQIFKPGIDTRFSKDYIQDRNGNQLKAVNIDNIDEIKEYEADVYIIDEFQFLNGDVKVIEDLAQEGKKFYIAGLNLTAEKKPFGKMGDLLCVSDHVTTMTSICDICKRDNAIFSFYKGDNKSGDIELNDSDYIPVCRECYNEMVKKYKEIK
jgi:thymidine kinase